MTISLYSGNQTVKFCVFSVTTTLKTSLTVERCKEGVKNFEINQKDMHFFLYSTITSTYLGLSASDGEGGTSVTSSSSSSSSSPSSTGLLGATWLVF